MSPEIIASAISLGGAIISVMVSLFVSSRQTKTELEKLRTEIRQTYANKLLEKRIETYPQIYYYLSEFMKSFTKNKNITKNLLEQFKVQVDEWDSKYAIFITGRTSSILYQFRKMLSELLRLSDEELQKRFQVYEEIRTLRTRIGELEIALKNDIGIYIVEFENANKEFSSYKEIAQAREESSK